MRNHASSFSGPWHIFHSVWKRKFRIGLLTIAVFCALLFSGIPHMYDSASGTITLSYGNAFKGLTPNGTRFNIYDIISTPIMSKTLQEIGLEGHLTTEELAACISVAPSLTESISKRHISNVYTVSLTLPDTLPVRLNADNVLDILLRIYHKDFSERYAPNYAVLDMDWSEAFTMEFNEFSDLLYLRISSLKRYLDELAGQTSVATYHLEEESFRSLYRSLENFKTLYVDNYTAYINEQHLFRDAEAFYRKLEYKKRMLERSYSLSDAFYRIRKDALEDYDASVITAVMVPMYNSTDGLYMARTDTGTDDLAIASADHSATSKTIAEQLTSVDYLMTSTQNASRDPMALQRADTMIEAIIRDLNALIARIRTSVDEYEVYSANSAIICSVKNRSFFSLLNVKRNLVICGIFAIVLCTLCMVADYGRTPEPKRKIRNKRKTGNRR